MVLSRMTETLVLNIENPTPVKAYGSDLPVSETFTYLGNIVKKDGGAEDDINKRKNKARNIMRMLNNIWRSTHVFQQDKIENLQQLRIVHPDLQV